LSADTLNPNEIAKFNALADAWWAPHGPTHTLHDINPCRTEFIAERMRIDGASIIDIGCGGGVLTESLAARGARMVGIDAATDLIAVATTHAQQSNLTIRYQTATAEQFALQEANIFDAVVCMELLEHVASPATLLAACRRLVKPTGHLFLSTLNRTLRSYLEAILGAEYLLRLLPIGTHNYAAFVTPAELARLLRAAEFDVLEVRGMRYNPLTRRAHLVAKPQVNYLVHARAQ
jgi:2-polyprenyl-6-hydroxyphenyl methylase/3-demethylubiquinone-9 3-methyltransferase